MRGRWGATAVLTQQRQEKDSLVGTAEMSRRPGLGSKAVDGRASLRMSQGNFQTTRRLEVFNDDDNDDDEDIPEQLPVPKSRPKSLRKVVSRRFLSSSSGSESGSFRRTPMAPNAGNSGPPLPPPPPSFPSPAQPSPSSSGGNSGMVAEGPRTYAASPIARRKKPMPPKKKAAQKLQMPPPLQKSAPSIQNAAPPPPPPPSAKAPLIDDSEGSLDPGEMKEEIMAPAASRPQSLERQESWYKEAVAQGMSIQNLEDMIGGPLEMDGLLGNGTNNEVAGKGSPNAFHQSFSVSSSGYTAPVRNRRGRDPPKAQAPMHGFGIHEGVDENMDDEEVLEQVRMLSLLEAKQRLKARLGHDPSEEDSKPSADADKEHSGDNEYTAPTPLTRPPLLGTGGAPANGHRPGQPALRKSQPAEPFPLFQDQLLDLKCPRQPELQAGVVLPGGGHTFNASFSTASSSAHIQQGQMPVRCLGCNSCLAVSRYATLVSCPECHTVSPASCTRR